MTAISSTQPPTTCHERFKELAALTKEKEWLLVLQITINKISSTFFAQLDESTSLAKYLWAVDAKIQTKVDDLSMRIRFLQAIAQLKSAL